jgi:hypothetical protein
LKPIGYFQFFFFIFLACHRSSPSRPTSPWWPIKLFGPFLLWA